MSLSVVRPGMMTSLQDLGRPRKQRYGVPVGGAMDSYSLRVANILVGNPEGEAALEMSTAAPTLRFDEDALIAICGAGFAAHVGGESVPHSRPVFTRKGNVLTIGAATAGCWGYLAVAGGFDVPLVMGSRSTYARGGFGGYEGRCLQAGDVLPTRAPAPLASKLLRQLGEQSPDAKVASCRWQAGSNPPPGLLPKGEGETIDCTLRVIVGSEFGWLTPQSQEQLFAEEFEVTPQSDRMGYRLTGPGLRFHDSRELLSTAVCAGTIQLPPSGDPILLMADCATTGGYPKIGHVASVDLPSAAQARPGTSCDSSRFRWKPLKNSIASKNGTCKSLSGASS